MKRQCLLPQRPFLTGLAVLALVLGCSPLLFPATQQKAGKVNVDRLSVRSEPWGKIVDVLTLGQSVTILSSVEKEKFGQNLLWHEIRYEKEGQPMSGYVAAPYITSPDAVAAASAPPTVPVPPPTLPNLPAEQPPPPVVPSAPTTETPAIPAPNLPAKPAEKETLPPPQWEGLPQQWKQRYDTEIQKPVLGWEALRSQEDKNRILQNIDRFLVDAQKQLQRANQAAEELRRRAQQSTLSLDERTLLQKQAFDAAGLALLLQSYVGMANTSRATTSLIIPQK